MIGLSLKFSLSPGCFYLDYVEIINSNIWNLKQ